MKKWIPVGMCLALVGTLTVGCGSNNAQPSTQGQTGQTPDQTLNLSLGGEIPTLDSSLATDTSSFDILGQVEEGLTRLDQQGNVVPGVAKTWDVSKDGLSYVFHLRDDAKWSDGSPVTAKDFEYAWKRTLNPDTKSEYAYMLEWVKGGTEYNTGKGPVEGVMVKAVDDKTLNVTLDSPKAFFLAQLSFPVFFPQKQSFVEQQGNKYGSDADKTLYDGPFKMDSWVHDQSAVIVKNDNYWDKDNVKLTKVTYQMVKENSTAENLYQTGRLDRISLVQDMVDNYKGKPEVSTTSDLAVGYLLFNQKIPVLQNVNIRKALTYSVDVNQYSDVVYHDGTVGADGYVPKGTSDGNGGDFRKDNGDLMDRKDNMPKAKDYLQQGLKEAGMTEFPKITLLASDADTSKKAAEFLQAQWKQNLGISIDIQMVPLKLRQQRAKDKDYQILLTNWGADYNDPMTFMDMWVSDSTMNRSGWKNPTYDQLVKNAQTEPDAAKRMQELEQAEKVLIDNMGLGPIYFSGSTYATKSYVKGWVDRSFGTSYDLKYVSVASH